MIDGMGEFVNDVILALEDTWSSEFDGYLGRSDEYEIREMGRRIP